MNPDDVIPDPPPQPGPIEDAYLHRDVHPDEKAGHEHKLSDSDLFPKPDTAVPSDDDIWMYS